jgi:sortase A
MGWLNLRLLERILFYTGVLGAVFVAVAYLHALTGSSRALAAFEDAVAQQAAISLEAAAPDQSLWSETRKRKYAELSNSGTPLAVLEIERLSLQVPVFAGTDPVTLNRGAGIVDGTAYPDETGNMVVSAHRDSFFRALKDIAVGDRIDIRTLQGTRSYVVDDLFITDPLDVSVLRHSETAELTLITCYPFYFVGYAPERLIVRALPVDSVAYRPIDSTQGAAVAAEPALIAQTGSRALVVARLPQSR